MSTALSTAGHTLQIVGDRVRFDAVFTDAAVANYHDTVYADSEKNLLF